MTTDASSDDLAGLDLSPANDPTGSFDEMRKAKPWLAIFAVALVVVGLGAVLFKGLTSAAVYFKNVDEAVAERTELGDKTFRMQGIVQPDTVKQTSGGAEFVLAYGGKEALVSHTGSEPALFSEPDIPVVVIGNWNGSTFESSEIVIAHDESYVEENPDRIAEAESETQK